MINLKLRDTLFAFYDFKVAPATFDIVKFLVLAERERQRLKLEFLHVLIVPGIDKGFRSLDLLTYKETGADDYTVGTMRWRLTNIVVPCCWLMPSCKGVTVFPSRLDAAYHKHLTEYIFPPNYTVGMPRGVFQETHVNYVVFHGIELPSLSATPQALVYVGDYLKRHSAGRKVITVVLRECLYERDRNSNYEAWSKFIRGLNRDEYYPLIVRDTEVAMRAEPLELAGLDIFYEASWNLELNMALFELSYLSMFTNGGVAGLARFNKKAPCLVFKMITPSCDATTELFFKESGMPKGMQPLYLQKNQRLVWEDDDYEVIQREFDKWVQSL